MIRLLAFFTLSITLIGCVDESGVAEPDDSRTEDGGSILGDAGSHPIDAGPRCLPPPITETVDGGSRVCEQVLTCEEYAEAMNAARLELISHDRTCTADSDCVAFELLWTCGDIVAGSCPIASSLIGSCDAVENIREVAKATCSFCVEPDCPGAVAQCAPAYSTCFQGNCIIGW